MADNVNRLLIVEDEPEVAEFVAAVASRLGFSIASTGGAEFAQLVDSFRPTLILLDLHLPDTDGVELLRKLVDRGSKAHVLLTSGVDERVLSAAYDLGASRGLAMCGTLAKPVMPADLQNKLAAVMHRDRELDVADLKGGLAAGGVVAY